MIRARPPLLTKNNVALPCCMSSHVVRERESFLCTSYIQLTRTTCQPCPFVGYSYTAAISAWRLEATRYLRAVHQTVTQEQDHTRAKRSDILEATRNTMAKACVHCSYEYVVPVIIQLGSWHSASGEGRSGNTAAHQHSSTCMIYPYSTSSTAAALVLP